jgi:hypothetical protein
VILIDATLRLLPFDSTREFLFPIVAPQTSVVDGYSGMQMELTEFMRNAASAFAHLQAQVLELGIHQQGP